MTYSTDGIECPYCGHIHHPEPSESMINSSTEMDCEACEKTFVVWAEVEISYRTRPTVGGV